MSWASPQAIDMKNCNRPDQNLREIFTDEVVEILLVVQKSGKLTRCIVGFLRGGVQGEGVTGEP